jgi:cell filamentation protein
MASGASSGDYDAIVDPYCYPGTTLLINIPDLRDPTALAEFEGAVTAQRADEALPDGRLSVRHYQAIHHHLFQDVFSWAGKFRTVRLSKGGNAFCYPEHIAREMRKLFGEFKGARGFTGLSRVQFAERAAHFLATLNAIHPFREGNGRTQTAFLDLWGDRAGHPLALDRLIPEHFLAAMIQSFQGDEGPLREEISRLIAD